MAGAGALAAQLAGPALQVGFGVYNAVKGNQVKKEGEAGIADARQSMEDTKYADYNQAYYDELQRRESVGLPQEQLMALQQGADRAAGVALSTSEDRRGGMMGIGRAQNSLSDAYRDIGLADVAQRQQNAQAVLGEMSDRGYNSYNEKQDINQLDMSLAEQKRQEGRSQQAAGFQGIVGGVGQAAPFIAGAFGGGGGKQFRQVASPTQGVNISGQNQQVTGLPQNPYYNPTYMGGGFSGGQGITYTEK